MNFYMLKILYKKIIKFWPQLLILFFWLCFFTPVFKGYMPLPQDALIGSYFPWLDYDYGYPTGVPVRNPTMSDVFAQEYPWRLAVMQGWQSGEIPLWNPYSFSGSPLAANWQSAVFYPLTLMMVLGGSILGWNALIMAQPLLSMLFMFIYLRS